MKIKKNQVAAQYALARKAVADAAKQKRKSFCTCWDGFL